MICVVPAFLNINTYFHQLALLSCHSLVSFVAEQIAFDKFNFLFSDWANLIGNYDFGDVPLSCDIQPRELPKVYILIKWAVVFKKLLPNCCGITISYINKLHDYHLN